MKESIRNAADECIAEGILREFFENYKDEVDEMFSLMYDEKRALEVAREEGKEDGVEIGVGIGYEKGVDIGASILRALKQNEPIEDIAARFNQPVSKIIYYRTILEM